MEPLTCRGRRGHRRARHPSTGYADARLEPHWDWQKYEYWYRVWGRMMYNPDTGADVWRPPVGGARGQGSALRSAWRPPAASCPS